MTDKKIDGPYGPLTSDIERADLIEALNLLSETVLDYTTHLSKCLVHLLTCENPKHRAQMVKSISVVVTGMMEQMRMVGWMEERLVPGLIDGTATLAALKADAARAAAFRAEGDSQSVQTAETPADTGGEQLRALFTQNVVGEVPPAQTRKEQLDGFDADLVTRVTDVGPGSKQ